MSQVSGAPIQGIQVEGARELRRQLKAAGDDLTEMKAIHHKVGSLVAKTSKILAPRSPDSTHIAETTRASQTKTASVVKVGNNRKKGNASFPYANPIHWGWFTRPNPAKGWRGGAIKPRFWVSRAAAQTEPEWFRIYEDYVNKTLDQVKGKP